MRFKPPIFPVRLMLAFFFVQLAMAAWSQPQADFTTNKTGGCSPLFISFTNTTTNASDNATWYWDFGNGNTSLLQNPGAIFHGEKTYTITLTVTDGAHTSTKTKTITVYKRPVVDFEFSPQSGCLPLQVSFTSTATPGDGDIVAWQWDFGDGHTQQALVPSLTHTYQAAQTASVSLTVVDNNGCSNTIHKKDIITAAPSINVDFAADRTIACSAPATIRFTDNSQGPGNLSYEWSFGDGNTSTEKDPVHTYTQSNTYTVTLTVKNEQGCVVTRNKNGYVNINNFHTDFSMEPPLCTETIISFRNISVPVPQEVTWLIDGLVSYTTFGNDPVNHSFATAGPHTVEMTCRYATCEETVRKTIQVNTTPKLNGFVANIDGLCGAPVQVHFLDTTAGAVKWQWNFDWYSNNTSVHSTIQNPTHTYQQDFDYYVALTVENESGCKANLRKPVAIARPLAGIFLADGYFDEGCGQLTTKFTTHSTEPVSSFSWNFGDSSPVSNEAEPTHTFMQPGDYNVVLTFTTINGCTGTSTFPVKVYEPAKADFIAPPTICGSTGTLFQNASTGYLVSYFWNFGDGSSWLTGGNPVFSYHDEGEYDVTLVAYNGLCNDTTVKRVTVVPPFPRIGNVILTCEGTRGKVVFADASRLADSWHWDFGDGHSQLFTAPPGNITHTYTASGDYMVVLTNTKGACTVKDSVEVHILLKQDPVLTAQAAEICLENGTLNIEVSGLQRFNIPAPFLPPHYGYRLVKPDGSDFVPSLSLSSANANALPWGATVAGFAPGDHSFKIISTSAYFGCRDTSNVVTVRVKGPEAKFTIANPADCFKSPVIIHDESVPRFDRPIVKWEWSFGDGQTLTRTTNEQVTHQYARPGSFPVTLKVADVDGCVATASRMANMRGPEADFYFSPDPVTMPVLPLNSTVSFQNVSNTPNANSVNYFWDFGNGNTAAVANPGPQVYTTAGDFIVTLIAVNAEMQCRDTMKKTVRVQDFNAGFTTHTAYIGDNGKCSPLLVQFNNTSVDYRRLVWNFGDGTTVENQSTPGHVYSVPGTYFVQLDVYGHNGLRDVWRDTIIVGKPVAEIEVDNPEGCMGIEVRMHAPRHSDIVSWAWDFGDGYVQTPADSFAAHQYLRPGSYSPSVYLVDAKGCAGSASAEKIIIHPDPVIIVSPEAPIACKTSAVLLHAGGADSYTWSPAAGLNDATSGSPTALPAGTTTYTVTGTDIHGCKNDTTITVVVPQPFAIEGTTDIGVCKGSAVQLNVNGADHYKWIGNTTGLSNTQVNNPTATPTTNSTYTVVGYDQYSCHSDTLMVNVNVHALPTVQAVQPGDIAYGAPTQLSASASSDVTRWQWSPAHYLSCTSCPAPVSRPQTEIDYVVTVYNSHGCEAKDTISLKTICAEAGIYIPNAFTPNGDGKNDLFTINGHGVRMVKSLRIYNRWGEMVFERKNFFPNDNASAWNGRFKGVEAPAGSYVYFSELECEAGQVFQRKGTVTLLR